MLLHIQRPAQYTMKSHCQTDKRCSVLFNTIFLALRTINSNYCKTGNDCVILIIAF